MLNKIKQAFKDHQLALNNEQAEKLGQLVQLYHQCNQEVNLSAIKDINEIISKHLIDSILITKFFDLDNKKILDLGTGGGFPCLPLAIYTKANFVALDSTSKKIDKVNYMAKQLNLPIKTIVARAEEMAHQFNYREKFDVVLTRAVAPWPILLELSLALVKKNGALIAYQGPAIKNDLQQYAKYENFFGGELVQIKTDTLNNQESRFWIEIRKIRSCPDKYPRTMSQIKNKLIC